jgi:hypothetical protein
MKLFGFFTQVVVCGAAGLVFFAGCSKQGQQVDTTVDVSAMIQQLQSPEEQDRADACIALGAAGPRAEEAVPALTQTLRDPSSLVQGLAAYALGQIGPKAAPAIPALMGLMSSSDPEAARAAMSAIRAIDPSGMDPGAPSAPRQ